MALTALKSLKQVEEGKLAKNLDHEIRTTVAKLLEHVQEHTEERCRKQKATVTLKLDIECIGADGQFTILGSVVSKLPTRPRSASAALMHLDADGMALFVRPSGSSADDPRQKVLATQDGRAVDLETGKAREPVAPKPGGVREAQAS